MFVLEKQHHFVVKVQGIWVGRKKHQPDFNLKAFENAKMNFGLLSFKQ
jgi:hypothetical protein